MRSGTGAKSATYTYEFEDVKFYEGAASLSVSGVNVALERRPLDVLSTLLAHVDEVVTKEELIETVWQGRATVENVLPNAITKLRKALGDNAANRIVTHPRIGYRFSGPVERIATGRSMKSAFALESGASVVGRDNFILRNQLSSAEGREVWLATHTKTGERRVFKFASDGVGLSALKREVTISRLLRKSLIDSSCVAPIEDWNFSEEPFFIESAYSGENLKSWAVRDDQLLRLAFHERCALALSIVEAVAQIHSAGVLHKDLKPANILIKSPDEDKAGLKAVLADFGAGRVLLNDLVEAQGVTPMGLTLDETSISQGGTAAYLAPEVINGQAPSVQSDVYALGVLIFQIVRGDVVSPLTANWMEAIDDPLLRDDIAAATKDDPNQRIASADALARKLRTIEVRRDEAIQKRIARERLVAAESALQRARARRPWLILTGLILLAGVCVSLVFAWRADEARREAEHQNERALASSNFLRDLIVSADPRTPGIAQDASVKDALSRASELMDNRFAADPQIHAEMKSTLAEVYSGISDFSAEVDARKKAADILSVHVGPTQPETVEAKIALVNAYIRNAQFEDATTTLDALEFSTAPVFAVREGLKTEYLMARGRLHLNRLEIDQAIELLEMVDTTPDHLTTSEVVRIAALRHDLSQALSRVGRHDEAISILRDLLAPNGQFVGSIPDWRRGDFILAYGAALVFASQHDDALPVLDDALIIRKNIFGDDSREVGDVYGMIGSAHSGVGRWKEAMIALGEARRRVCAAYGDDHVQCLSMTGNEGVAKLELNDFENAELQIRKVRDAFAALAGELHPAVQVMNYHLSRAVIERGGVDEVAKLLEAMSPDEMETAAPGNHWAVRVDGLRGLYLIRTGSIEKGQLILSSAVEKMKEHGFPEAFVDRYSRGLIIEERFDQ